VKDAAEAVRDPRPAAQRVRDAAKELFYRQGIHATGVEEVCRVAGATKMSLYRAFPSKDALVEAILREECEVAAAIYARIAEVPPAERPRAVIAAVADVLREPNFRGCPMGIAITEYPDPSHPVRQVADAYKRKERDQLREVCREAGLRDPATFGDALLLLIEGAFSIAPSLGNEDAARMLERSAEALFASQGAGSGARSP